MREQPLMAPSARTTTARRIATLALAVLGVSGWGAFAYSSWSAGRTERALQGQIARLEANRTGSTSAKKPQGQEGASMRTVYADAYGPGAPAPAQAVPAAVAPARSITAVPPSNPVAEPTAAEPSETRMAMAVPSQSPSVQSPAAKTVALGAPEANRADAVPQTGDPGRVDINTASVEELNRLGGRFGRAIVAGRPYASVDELVSKRVLTRSTFSQIKDQITAN